MKKTLGLDDTPFIIPQYIMFFESMAEELYMSSLVILKTRTLVPFDHKFRTAAVLIKYKSL